MKLIIVHNHFRPGGVRRVIELATPHLVRSLRPRIREVLLVGSAAPEADWWNAFERSLRPWAARCQTDPALGYTSEQQTQWPGATRKDLRAFLSRILDDTATEGALVWAHNQGLGRNLLLTRELQEVCAARRVPLVLHHHDWWFDNRWQRWPEMRQNGFRSLSEVAAAIFPGHGHVRHLAINQADAAILARHLGAQTGWVPNPASESVVPTRAGTRAARRWLEEQLGHDSPVWLMPCRLLRRKNIAEALLLTRWLRPEAWLVTTAGVTSREEEPYANRLMEAARRQRWPLRLSILGNAEKGPAVSELLAASEAGLVTSLQEGFGLPFVEAAIAGTALIARRLPNIASDLERWGLRLPQSYEEVLVSPKLFDWSGEVRRQRRLFRQWCHWLPAGLPREVERPLLLTFQEPPSAIPFSRLSLTAQLEVLAHPAPESWSACAPLNPWLFAWRAAAAKGTLDVTAWPRRAAQSLSGTRFAARFAEILAAAPRTAVARSASVLLQRDFIREKLQRANLYPLTWSPDT